MLISRLRRGMVSCQICFEGHKYDKYERILSIIGVSFDCCCWKSSAGTKQGYVDKPNEEIAVVPEHEMIQNQSDDEMNRNDAKDVEDEQELSSSSIMKQLIEFGKPDYLLLSFGFLSIIMTAISESFVPYYVGQIINVVVVDNSTENFHQALLYLVLANIVAGFALGLRTSLFIYSNGRYTLRLRQVLFTKLMRMEIGFFDEHTTGELTSRLTSDVEKIGDGIRMNLDTFIRYVVKIFCFFCFMTKLSWKLSIVPIVFIPIIVIVSNIVGEKCTKVANKIQNSLAKSNESAVEAISSIRTVRTFSAEKEESERYSNLLIDILSSVRRRGIINGGYRWVIHGLTRFMEVIILYYGGHLVFKGELAVGSLVSFMSYTTAISNHLLAIGNVYTNLVETVGASKNIFRFINRSPLLKTNDVIPSHDMKGHIEFKGVSFAYPTRKDLCVLKGINFTAEKGEVVALVGPSGGGKSSIINLLQHFYEPTQGEILIDGVSVTDYDHDFLHTKMSLVQQEPVLFARSVSENIKYGVKCATTDDDITNAAKLANAHEFISSMPDEYQTQTGEKGVQVSGGQKQRIAIARALIRNPYILLLDEATSALDSESEYLVQEAINKNLGGKTVIVIAHRLSTVKKADKIVVIDNGEIVEVGKHFELVEKQGTYAALVGTQIIGLSDG